MQYTVEQLQQWNTIIDGFRKSISAPSFEMWIAPLRLHAVTENEVIATFEDPNTSLAQMQHYQPRIESFIRAVFGKQYSFRVIDRIEPRAIDVSTLNPRYTFDNFVTGPSNEFAYAASMAVAEQPGHIYNPLFIYGDTGLGKTHLLNAIGNYIHIQNPVLNVLLTTCERFTNELIEAISKKNGGAALRAKMRNVDVLMVDDIQFLSRTTIAQEEFFHTFNDLIERQKHIVLSSDRPPNEIPTIQDRLRTRFGSGLIVDISKPDYETRAAILRRKADDEEIDIPFEVVEYIASHFDRSIRELEGAFTSVIARSRVLGYPISLELAQAALGNLVHVHDSRVVTPKTVIEVVSKRYDVSEEDLISNRRSHEIVVPRQIAIYICRELTGLSTNQIGKAFGGRDHTTVMHSCEKVIRQMNQDPAFKKRVDDVIDMVKNN